MPNKTFVRCLAVLACLGILALSVTGLSAAAKSSNKLNFVQILRQPGLLLSSLVPVLNPSAGQMTAKAPGRPALVRPTTDIPVPRPGTGD
ncbi:MAG: hypothetical protein NTZ26_09415 [Candidatus Aminicenantes bacterium]|nr:hypothetical protein [Candidatus Aminicenantes bacterium]